MTVSCETRRFTYACDGATRKWPVEFNYIDGGTVKVFLIGADGEESEVKNVTVSGGYVTAPATGDPFSTGNSVRVERILPFTQLDDYTAQGNFTPENMERTADNMVMLAQQIRDVADDTDGYVTDNLGKIEEYKDAAIVSAAAASESAATASGAMESAVNAASEAASAMADARAASEAAADAKGAAESARDVALSAKEAADASKGAAETAMSRAEEAEAGASAVRDEAVSAKAAAETAKSSAEASAASASAASASALESAASAESSAAQAAQSAESMEPGTVTPPADSDEGSAGTSAKYAREDHSHPRGPEVNVCVRRIKNMKINLSPQVRADSISVVKSGDALTINGVVYDFTPLTEGSTLPAEAIDCEYFVGEAKREKGDIELTLLLPIGVNATEAQRFPEPLIVYADGEVALP